ncbi:SLP adapter and CSK-interacting membrane protein [Erinaceus europaeus]|uniref:SLP adapter and CSK-interacting membrane protein n=1 Tax=Erinaceus europaeus TaxID=9365 RepID=A0A1S2ZR60_ERIEU|nr:SLP adapter and CSK-interacting membrane protein [Erinaceus europaeus]
MQEAQDSMVMQWLRRNFWIILAVTIITVSVLLGLMIYGICRWLLRKGKKLEITKTWKQKQKDDEKMYENVSQSPAGLPPLPPRGLLSSADSTPQERLHQPPVMYSKVIKAGKKTPSIPSYIEPEDDYDDVDISATMERHHFESAVSSFWQAEENSHNLF